VNNSYPNKPAGEFTGPQPFNNLQLPACRLGSAGWFGPVRWTLNASQQNRPRRAAGNKKPAWQLAFAFHSTPPHFAESLFKPRPKVGERGFPFPADSNRW